MKTFTTIDHARLLNAAKHKHTSLDEKIFLGHMANLAAAKRRASRQAPAAWSMLIAT